MAARLATIAAAMSLAQRGVATMVDCGGHFEQSCSA
eukprot:CAMPEP_0115762052 /NCGR_PEP_ID=MMETSP0272-20121206/100827_1 /TAXON_ID=71861 /ORGANISM="Scrippsiella trochoidea, Strain CCMP3099" /LENGTH=35 /DNA_ID= /DNA_START= /DNA_END= /DNA_ORIENTATION=